ncbi:CbtA family protein [Azospirillum sp. B506]|uniref:CbtA family protein n=1 Tax=Azospirillum sp. B506 TaxID=137721 RepID=UPI00034A8EA2|nr:CbtA family protein [Azospirillum sp. B506]
MQTFRSIVFTALAAGLLVGLVTTLVHQVGVVPLILEAETYEAAEAVPAAAHSHSHDQGHGHDTAAASSPEHHHDAKAWTPQDGWERTLFTALADVLTSTGFALLMSSAFVLVRRRLSWREGLLWGLAGFTVFSLAPSLGLPPELPGMAAGDLMARQMWWIGTAMATALGLTLIASRRSGRTIALAAILLAAPHIIGAPAAPAEESGVPMALWSEFVIVALASSLVSWLALGSITAAFHRRLFA